MFDYDDLEVNAEPSAPAESVPTSRGAASASSSRSAEAAERSRIAEREALLERLKRGSASAEVVLDIGGIAAAANKAAEEDARSKQEAPSVQAPAGAEAETEAVPGLLVQFHGLVGRRDLNGARATLLDFLEDAGRWACELEDGEIVNVRPTNFKAIVRASEAASPGTGVAEEVEAEDAGESAGGTLEDMIARLRRAAGAGDEAGPSLSGDGSRGLEDASTTGGAGSFSWPPDDAYEASPATAASFLEMAAAQEERRLRIEALQDDLHAALKSDSAEEEDDADAVADKQWAVERFWDARTALFELTTPTGVSVLPMHLEHERCTPSEVMQTWAQWGVAYAKQLRFRAQPEVELEEGRRYLNPREDTLPLPPAVTAVTGKASILEAVRLALVQRDAEAQVRASQASEKRRKEDHGGRWNRGGGEQFCWNAPADGIPLFEPPPSLRD